MSIPQGMTSEIGEYIQEMIRLNHMAHDGDIRDEMDAREAKTKIAIAGEVATLRAMAESLHTETGAAFQKLKTEADEFTKKLEEADTSARDRVEDFRKKGNELDAKVVEGFTKIEGALIDMRANGAAQVATGDAAMARFDTLVAQAKSTHDANLKEIVDKVRELESRGSGPAAGGTGQATAPTGQDPWFGQSLGAAHRDGSTSTGAR